MGGKVASGQNPGIESASRRTSIRCPGGIGVTTSTLWGVTGIGIIAVSLLVLVGAVARFGRR